MLEDLPGDSYEGIMINAMEWFLADGVMTIKGQDHRVADLLLGRGGPLFSAEQRQWLELLTAMPLRLYEIINVIPGESMTVRDVLLPERPPVVIREKSGSRQTNPYDLMAARILPVGNHFELSGAVYAFPRNRSWDLLEELRDELEGVEPDSPLAKEITSVIIPYYWLQLFVNAFERPQLVDHLTGKQLLFVTDHYRVQNWAALDQALSGEEDIEGSREDSWNRFFEGEDGLIRRSLSIDASKRQDRIKVSREISDPKGLLANLQPKEGKETSELTSLPPEMLTELIETRIHQLYAD